MAIPDASAVDEGLRARLASDADLQAYMPDGVWFDVVGKKNATRYVIVTQTGYERNRMFGGVASEVFTYLVKAVERSTATSNIRRAAHRIAELLDGQDFAIEGYRLMLCAVAPNIGDGRVRYQEPDPANQDERWQHRGWHFELWVCPQT